MSTEATECFCRVMLINTLLIVKMQGGHQQRLYCHATLLLRAEEIPRIPIFRGWYKAGQLQEKNTTYASPKNCAYQSFISIYKMADLHMGNTSRAASLQNSFFPKMRILHVFFIRSKLSASAWMFLNISSNPALNVS